MPTQKTVLSKSESKSKSASKTKSGKDPNLLLNPFTIKVMNLVRQIPAGQVATYGQIAKLAGKPQGSRGVGWILHSSSRAYQLPWHRVLNSKGQISFPKEASNHALQKRRLEKEGVEFLDHKSLDLKKYQWKKKPKTLKSSRNQPKMFRSKKSV